MTKTNEAPTRYDMASLEPGDIVRNHNNVKLVVVTKDWGLNDKVLLGGPILLLRNLEDRPSEMYGTPEGLIQAGYRVVFKMDGTV